MKWTENQQALSNNQLLLLLLCVSLADLWQSQLWRQRKGAQFANKLSLVSCLRFVNAVKHMLEKNAKEGALIILESSVGVGDTRRTFKEMCSRGFLVANSPERIDPARKVPTLQDVPKVVGGVNPESTKAASTCHSPAPQHRD